MSLTIVLVWKMYIKTINGLDAALRLRFFTKIQIRTFYPTRYFVAFTKILKRISRLSIMEVWILWIICKTEYFGFWIHAPKRFLATDPNGVNTVSGNTKQF